MRDQFVHARDCLLRAQEIARDLVRDQRGWHEILDPVMKVTTEGRKLLHPGLTPYLLAQIDSHLMMLDSSIEFIKLHLAKMEPATKEMSDVLVEHELNEKLGMTSTTNGSGQTAEQVFMNIDGQVTIWLGDVEIIAADCKDRIGSIAKALSF